MAAPTVADLGVFLGRTDLNDLRTYEQVTAALSIVTALAKGYTRGQGFTGDVPADDLRAVILTAAARLFTDPSGMVEQSRQGPFSVTYSDHYGGWSTGELTILNRYRLRAL